MEKETSKTIITIVAIIAATVILVALRNALGPVGNSNMAVALQPNAVDNGGDAPAPSAVDVAALPDDDPSMAQGNPKVTVVEFTDYQCPFCKRFYDDAYQKIINEYVKTGKIKYVSRDFPLSFHPNAKPAAIAAECADAQGKFWPYHDKLFQNQALLSDENYLAWAKDLGLDVAKFTNCLTDPAIAAEVDADFQAGQAAGVSGTPTLFVNGRMVVGAQPFESFKAAIDAELQ